LSEKHFNKNITNTPKKNYLFYFLLFKTLLGSFDLGQFSTIPKKKERKKKQNSCCIIHPELILSSRKKLVELSSSPTR